MPPEAKSLSDDSRWVLEIVADLISIECMNFGHIFYGFVLRLVSDPQAAEGAC